MALTDEGGGMNTTMLVSPNGYMGGNGFGNAFGGDWAWIILLLLLGWGNNGWGNGMGFDGGIYPWMNQANLTSNGFQNQMLNDTVTSIRDGIAALATQLCNCCADTQMAIAQGFAGVESGANARQMANMQTAFNMQTAMAQGFNGIQAQLAQCCCDNRAATQDVKYTIATEACANRATSTANTQAILDKLCQLELDNYKTQLDNKNDTIAQLRSEILYAKGQASQDVQTAELRANNATVANQLLSEMRSCPIPAQPVYGTQPIFTCNGNSGCGCGNF